MEAVMRGGPGDENRAGAFVGIVRGAQELHQQLVPSDVALRQGLAALRIETDRAGLPSIHDVTGGQHTVDLQAPVGPSDE